MKKSFLVIPLIFLFVGCHMNPNKEDRIQKLETEMQMISAKVNQLENKLHTLEDINKQLQTTH